VAIVGRNLAWIVALAGVVVVTTVSGRAGAEEPSPTPAAAPDLDEARRLFREAVEVDRAGDPAGALALYERARAITVSGQILFNIGSCEERLGRMLAAARSYRAAEAEAMMRHNDEVERAARTGLAHLEVVTPQVRVVLAVDLEGIEVRLDDAVIQPSTQAIAVDPGDHHLVARAPDERVFALEFRMNERERRTIEVSFASSTGGVREIPVPVVVTEPPPPPSYLPVMIGGAATVVLGTVAGITFAAGRTKKDRYETLNAGPTPGSEDERRQLSDDGKALYVTSTVFGISAALAAGTTLTLLVRTAVARSKRTSASAVWVAPALSGLRLGGVF
jgi:hypothetical protein